MLCKQLFGMFDDVIRIHTRVLHMYVHMCVCLAQTCADRSPSCPFFPLSVAERRRREASTESISLKVIFPLLRIVLRVTPSLTGSLFSANLVLLSRLLAPLSLTDLSSLILHPADSEGCDGQCLLSQRPTDCTPRCSFQWQFEGI